LLFDVRAALFALLGKDLTQINGLGLYLALKLIAECGDDLSAWPSAKHFTSWLCLAPSNKISGGKVLSSRTRRSGSRAAALLRLAAATVGRTDTALGAFYRRLSARIGKAKAVTATARKIAVLFYNAVQHGMEYVDPGASSYETRYRARVIDNLHRRAKAFGFVLEPIDQRPASTFLRKNCDARQNRRESSHSPRWCGKAECPEWIEQACLGRQSNLSHGPATNNHFITTLDSHSHRVRRTFFHGRQRAPPTV
jgi:Transposase IS116/IS110/IS902 family